MTVNPNLFVLSFHRASVSVNPEVTAPLFKWGLVGWNANGPSDNEFRTDFNNSIRVGMVMPYDGFIHSWAVRHGGYPDQQQGKWRWALIRNTAPNVGIEESAFEDVANPTPPFNPGGGEHLLDVFDKRVGHTDEPLFFEKGDFFSWALGSNRGIFTVKRSGAVSCSVSVFGEFLR